jgi:L,D-transpeptidase ErfK/SrfK
MIPPSLPAALRRTLLAALCGACLAAPCAARPTPSPSPPTPAPASEAASIGTAKRTGAAEAARLARQLVGGVSTHCVERGQTLSSIAAGYGEPLSLLLRDNGLRIDAVLSVGSCLRIDNRKVVPPDGPPDGVLINIPERMLFRWHDGVLAAAYPVALGRPDWPTPVGRWRVAQLRSDPVWHVPASIREEARLEGKLLEAQVPSGPDNPLGHWWIGLDANGYGIHGTNAPSSLYGFRTHGCIRLRDDHAGALFASVRPGTPVHIVYRTWLLAELPDTSLWLQSDPDPYRRGDVEADLRALHALARRHGLDSRIDWPLARRLLERPPSIAERIDVAAGASAASAAAAPAVPDAHARSPH